MANPSPPAALLFIAPGCTHCPRMLEALATLIERGELGTLEVINVAAHPERAAELGARSAPWLRLGPFIFEGVHSVEELSQWASRTRTPEGLTAYLREQLASGHLPRARQVLAEDPERIAALVPLIEDPEVEMQARVGVGALLEALAGSAALQSILPQLQRLAEHDDHRVRTDACHYLGLTASADAKPILQARLDDDNAEVREVATDALETLEQSLEPV